MLFCTVEDTAGLRRLTMERDWLKLRILATSPLEKLGDTSLLICLTLQAIRMVLSWETKQIYLFKKKKKKSTSRFNTDVN